jgi:hypothetical protein
MAMDIKVRGAASGLGAEVDAAGNQLVILPKDGGGLRVFNENDDGTVTGEPDIKSNEVDEDYRSRAAIDLLQDEENFCYTAQNTGKHFYANTTMTNAWATGAMSTNSGGILTTTTGSTFGSYAYFPILGTHTLSFDIEGSFSAAPATNTVIDFGGFIRGAANPYAPADGAYFRLTAAGLQGVVNYNGTETTTAVFLAAAGGAPWAYTINKKYQFILYITPRRVEFWINDNGSVFLYGAIDTPIGNGQPCASSSVPFSVRHAIVGGAASSALSFQLARYSVRSGGAMTATTPSMQGNRLFGSYQGLSGGTMGTSARVGTITTGNETNVTAAVPTTTTAALGSGLGGTFWETATLAVNTDGIIMSYQVPAGTPTVPGRRLVLRGIYLNSYIQTAIAGGPFTAEWFLAFGHTAVSLATAEAAGTKAPRRILLPFTQQIAANQAVNTAVAQANAFLDLGDAPIFINPGEFVQLCTRHIGTVGTSGTIVHRVTPVYGWE